MVVEVSLVATRYGPCVMTGRVSKTLYGSDCAQASAGAVATNAPMAKRNPLRVRMPGILPGSDPGALTAGRPRLL